jgi:spermidine synthase
MEPYELSHSSDLFLIVSIVGILLVAIAAYRQRARLKLWAERVADWFGPEDPPKHLMWSLFLASFATLYIEIMMIRWIGTEVRIFAYFQNLALITCFLGFGLGCYWSGRRKSLLVSLVSLTLLVCLVQVPSQTWQAFLRLLSNQLSISPDVSQWGFLHHLRGTSVALLSAAAAVAVAVFLLFLVAVMVPLGQWVGYCLDSAPRPIRAYTVNLLGSVAGLWIFAGLAFFWLPPGYWFTPGFLILLFLLRRPSKRFAMAGIILLGVTLLLLRYSTYPADRTYWSPYQKVSLADAGEGQYRIFVNNTGYMNIYNLTADFLGKHPDVAQRFRQESSYDAPFRFCGHLDRVLIVGAGAGNDAAGALRNGAGHVDAVEIDPVVYSLGKRLHPEHPYESPNVRVILNDARAFLRRAQPGYDVILFGLLDSHTQFSDYSNMRIDNYVYTEEAFREARHLLGPDGVLVVKFDVREPWTWMGQRLYATLDHVFGRPPIAFHAARLGFLASATVFLSSDGDELRTRAQKPELAELIAQNAPNFSLRVDDAPSTATDDWPYLYHRGHSIPRTYFTVSIILLGMALLLVGRAFDPHKAFTWHFFLLGGGFLLLETQMVSRLALYFGTTWIVNSVVLTGILLVLVGANFVVDRWCPKRLGPYYVLLVAALLCNYLFPWQNLAYAAQTIGVLLSVAYLFPVFFAGIIFAESFRRCELKSQAFGANIVGAVAGGLTQNLSFILGMKALLLLAGLYYAGAGLSGLIGPRVLVQSGLPESREPAPERAL